MNDRSHIRLASRCNILKYSPIREIFEKAEQMTDLIRLEVGEPDFATPSGIKEACCEALEKGETKYTSTAGTFRLREAVAQKYEREHNIKVDPAKEVMISTGGAAAINLALEAIIDPGDEVLVPDPGWPQYIQLVRYSGGEPVYYSTRSDETVGDYGFGLDLNKLREKIGPKTKAAIINFPSNPTGAVMYEKECDELFSILKEYNILLISDEVYEKIIYDDFKFVSVASLPGMLDYTVLINSASKSYCMTGWRVGYALGPKEIIGEMSKLQSLTTICPNAAAQYAYSYALSGEAEWIEDMVSEYKRRRDFLVDGLNRIPGISCGKPLGTFYVFPDISELGISDHDFSLRLLEQYKVTSVPGIGFGPSGEGFVRFSYANSMENISLALEHINEFAIKLNK